jgi:hypothetical protein
VVTETNVDRQKGRRQPGTYFIVTPETSERPSQNSRRNKERLQKRDQYEPGPPPWVVPETNVDRKEGRRQPGTYFIVTPETSERPSQTPVVTKSD